MAESIESLETNESSVQIKTSNSSELENATSIQTNIQNKIPLRSSDNSNTEAQSLTPSLNTSQINTQPIHQMQELPINQVKQVKSSAPV